MFCILIILFYHPVSEATPNSKITGAYCVAPTRRVDSLLLSSTVLISTGQVATHTNFTSVLSVTLCTWSAMPAFGFLTIWLPYWWSCTCSWSSSSNTSLLQLSSSPLVSNGIRSSHSCSIFWNVAVMAILLTLQQNVASYRVNLTCDNCY